MRTSTIPPQTSPPAVPDSHASASHRTPAKFHLPGLDGLRALAAVAEVAYHALPTHLPGGFTGVDVFFVLSGFLITGLIIDEYDRSGGIAIRRFWLRRFRRLFPAVAATTLVMIPVAMLASTDLLVGIRRQFIGTLTFTFNWTEIAAGSTYFDRWNPSLLRNMWSLAVEQQFYLLWPLLLLLIVRLRRGFRPLLSGAIGALSLAWMVICVANDADLTRIYQGTDTHLFPLMIGATLALALPSPLRAASDQARHGQPSWMIWLRGLLSLAGLAAMFAGFFIISDQSGWAYPWGLLWAAVSAAFVIQGMVDVVSGRWGIGRALAAVLEVAPLRWLGHRSYALYLWHWPVLVVLQSLFPQVNPLIIAVVVLVLSILASALSYRWVETPMRFNGIIDTFKSWFAIPSRAATSTEEAR